MAWLLRLRRAGARRRAAHSRARRVNCVAGVPLAAFPDGSGRRSPLHRYEVAHEGEVLWLLRK